MSTFDGNVAEFPDIRIDRFTRNESLRPPLALFLSHVHTDHLVGLETCRAPFIYCSSATREILLKLEKYPHRMNFAKGILESRKQTYKAIGKLLKPIPLETPTTLELAPGRSIRVTLFDANHCVGAVMFLIEGDNKAILYTGDIRSELWWVNSLVRNPLLLPYVAAKDAPQLKRLDAIYLDTTFASKEDPYRQFPNKADGVMELLRQVSRHPADTLFYFDAWTFGYEDVWQALSSFLGSQIHVDDYRYGIYKALLQSDSMPAPETFKLMDWKCGNHIQEGCLSTQQHRIHSCEKGTGCTIWNKDFVRITPVISRHNGVDMLELGAGGGHGDLNQHHALDVDNEAAVLAMMQICAAKLPDQSKLLDIERMLTTAMDDPGSTLVLDAADLSQGSDVFEDLDGLSLESIAAALAKRVTRLKQPKENMHRDSSTVQGLPKQITFPYSRHSSYGELCLLVEAFMPKDIFPCTVDKNWKPEQSMEYLFGHFYDQPPGFRHDQFMLRNNHGAKAETSRPASRNRYSQSTQEYEDPKSRGRSRKVSPPPQSTRRRSTQDADRDREDRNAKRSRVVRGDFWPPLDSDHHSPPRPSSASEGEANKERQDNDARRIAAAQSKSFPARGLSRSSPARVARPGYGERRKSSVDQSRADRIIDLQAVDKPPEQINSWRRHIAAAQSKPSTGEDPFVTHKPARSRRESRASSRGHPVVRESPHVQPESYGRLSPRLQTPPATTPSAEDDVAVKLDGQVPSPDVSIELTEAQREAELRLALQHEAYHAAMGEGVLSWSEIGLVSVNGHQVKEEEL